MFSSTGQAYPVIILDNNNWIIISLQDEPRALNSIFLIFKSEVKDGQRHILPPLACFIPLEVHTWIVDEHFPRVHLH